VSNFVYRIPSKGVHCIILGEGFYWRHQAGGYSCLPKTATGKLEQVADHDAAAKLEDHFFGDKYGGWCDRGIDAQTADFISQVVPGFTVQLDAGTQNCEAWIHGYWHGASAILTWENSD
jgi:hypothetical protein